MALRAGATRQQVLDEARSYLAETIRSNPQEVERMVRSVDRFMKRLDRATRKKAAWVVFWNGPAVRRGEESIVAVLDPRKSQERVRDFIEQTYASANYSLTEKIRLATNRKDNPYPARMNVDPDYRLVSITCGHNPWLEARWVKNVRLVEDSEGHQRLTWDGQYPRQKADQMAEGS